MKKQCRRDHRNHFAFVVSVLDPGSVVLDPGSVVLDPGSVVLDPGSVVLDPGSDPGSDTGDITWVKIRIHT